MKQQIEGDSTSSQTERAPERPERFASYEEAVEYMERGLRARTQKYDSDQVPWMAKNEPESLERKPRNEFQLHIAYVSFFDFEKKFKDKIAQLPKIVLHDAYTVEDGMSPELKKKVMDKQKDVETLPAHIAEFEYIVDQTEKGNHPLQKEIQEAEARSDTKLAQILHTELQTFTTSVKESLKGFKNHALVVQDRKAWDTYFAEAAGLLKRFKYLEDKVNNHRPSYDYELPKDPGLTPADKLKLLEEIREKHEKEYIQYAEYLREFAMLNNSRLFAQGSVDINLYLYRHPDLAQDTRFEPRNDQSAGEEKKEEGVEKKPEKTAEKDIEKVVSSEVLLKEGFVEVHPVWPRTPLFSSMQPGTFKIVAYSEEEVKEKPQREGYAHRILYRSPDGKTFEKVLATNERFGWTTFAADSLIKSLIRKEGAPESDLSFNDLVIRDQGALKAGFARVTNASEPLAATFKVLKPGYFQQFTYSAFDIKVNPRLEGRIVSVIYKTSTGEWLRKDLTTDWKDGREIFKPDGMTQEAANEWVAKMEKGETDQKDLK